MIPDIFLVSPLFQKSEVYLNKFENPMLFGKLFLIDGELYKIEPDREGKGALRKESDIEEIKNVRSLGITFLSPALDENMTDFVSLIDYELKLFIRCLKNRPLSEQKDILLQSAFYIFLYNKFAINVKDGIIKNLLKETVLSSISYFNINVESQPEQLILLPVKIPDNREVAELLVNLTCKILPFFFSEKTKESKELADCFHKIINSLVLNQLVIYAQSGYKEERAERTIDFIVNELLLPQLDFIQCIMPSYKSINKLKETLSLIHSIYRRYIEKVSGIDISLDLKKLLKEVDKLSKEEADSTLYHNVKFSVHLARNSNVASLIYANSIILPYLYFIKGMFHYLMRADIIYFLTFLYNFVKMVDQVNDIINTLPYFLALSSEDEKIEKEELLFKVYEPGRLDFLKNLLKVHYFKLNLENNEKNKFYKIKPNNVEEIKYLRSIRNLRNCLSTMHGILPVPPFAVREELLNEKFEDYLRYCYDLFYDISNAVNKVVSALEEHVQSYIQLFNKSLEKLQVGLEESYSPNILNKLFDEVGEIQEYLRFLARDIPEIHDKMKQIAGDDRDSFAKEVNKILRKMYIYTPEFIIIDRRIQ